MQWSSKPNAGFTNADATPWLPIHPCFKTTNVDAESKDPRSILNCYKRLLQLRKLRPALHSGSLSLLPENALPPNVLGMRRAFEDDTIDVLLHFDDATRIIVDGSERARAIASTYETPVQAHSGRFVLRPYEALFIEK